MDGVLIGLTEIPCELINLCDMIQCLISAVCGSLEVVACMSRHGSQEIIRLFH